MVARVESAFLASESTGSGLAAARAASEVERAAINFMVGVSGIDVLGVCIAEKGEEHSVLIAVDFCMLEDRHAAFLSVSTVLRCGVKLVLASSMSFELAPVSALRPTMSFGLYYPALLGGFQSADPELGASLTV